MRIDVQYTPFPIHQGFHRTAVREKAAIGAVGSGKTIALCGDAISLGLTQPGSRIMVCRQSIPSLRESTELEFLNILASRSEDDYEDTSGPTLLDLCGVQKLGGHIERITFPNGTEYLFRSLDSWRKHMSLNLAAVYIDEASEVIVDAYNGLKTRLRQQQPTAEARRQGVRWKRGTIRQHIAVATNPNGHDWIWEMFVHAPNPQRKHFRSTSFDNPTLYEDDGTPNAYLQSLLTMPEMWVRRYVLCEFDAFEGQIFDWDQQRNMEPGFDPPAHWDRAMGLDWGLRNPTAIVWWARKPGTSRWHQYREWQSYDPMVREQRESHATMNVHQVAHTIMQLERGEKIKWRAADPAIKARLSESGKSIEYWFSTYGLYFQPGMKDHTPRINSLNQLLHDGDLVVSDRCLATAIAIQQYRWADLNMTRDIDGAEKPHKKNDHLVDASQYLATIFSQARRLQAKAKPLTMNDEIWRAVTRQVRRHAPKDRAKAQYAHG